MSRFPPCHRADPFPAMRRVALAALCALAICLPLATTWAEEVAVEGPSAQDWLERMNAALSQRPYRGTLVYVRDGRLDALRIVHQPAAGGIGERRLSTLSGEALEVVARADGLRFLDGEGHAGWQGGSAALPSAPRAVRPLPALYELHLAGADRIADRSAQVIEIRARDGFRYGHRLWLDRHSGLPLKSASLGSDGRVVEQLMFTEVQIDPPLPPSAALPVAPAVAPNVPDAPWQVLDAPEGFALALVDAGPSVHLLYSDGVAHVSVYVEALSAQQPTVSGAFGRGALQGFGRIAHGRQVVVVGDVPAATVERFAQGVTPATR